MSLLRFYKPTLLRSLCKIKSVKYFSQHPLKFSEVESRWKEKDGISQKWQLIYKAPMGNILNYAVTYLTISTAVVSASTIYYAAFVFDVATMNDPVLLSPEVVVANNSMECFIYLGAFVAFHAAVRVLLSKFVIRLYNNGDEYVAIFRGIWFNSIIKHKFHLQEFKKLNPTIVVSWGDARFGLGKKHGILIDKYFKTPEHFNYLLYKTKSLG